MIRSTSRGRGLVAPAPRAARGIALLDLVEEARVLDGDDRLVGEGLEQRDVVVRERGGPRCGRRRCAPMASPSRSIGDRDELRCPSSRPTAASRDVRASLGIRATWTIRPRRGSPGPRWHARRATRGTGAREHATATRRDRRSAPPISGSASPSTRGTPRRSRRRRVGAALSRDRVEHRAEVVGEPLITRRTSPVAVCCSSASVRSRLRACSSLNRRTFSMAITAWSAKVWSSAICWSVKGSPRHGGR